MTWAFMNHGNKLQSTDTGVTAPACCVFNMLGYSYADLLLCVCVCFFVEFLLLMLFLVLTC